MRRMLLAFVVLVGAVAVVLAAGASAAKPPPPAITAITTYGSGEASGTCFFQVNVTWSGRINNGEFQIVLKNAQGGVVSDQGGPLGRTNPAFLSSTASSSALPANGYGFTVTLMNGRGVALDTETTSTVSMTGCPAGGTALGQYPIPG